MCGIFTDTGESATEWCSKICNISSNSDSKYGSRRIWRWRLCSICTSVAKTVIFAALFMHNLWLLYLFNGLFSGQPGKAGIRKVDHSGFYWSKRWWGGSGIIWTIYKSFAPRSRQIIMPLPHPSVFTGRMPFLSPNQQRQSTEGII